jgi:hypothetical protein
MPPLAFAIHYPANGLTAGGAAVARLVAARLRRRFLTPRPVAQGSRRKNSCCVTTRCRNLSRLRRLWRRCGALTARTFGLGVLGFGRIVLAPFGLPLRRLPTPYQTLAFGVLAVTLVPTPWLVLASTPLAQADPRSRSARTGTAATVWLILATAHGSCDLPRDSPGRTNHVPLGRFSTPPSGRPPIYTSVHELDREGNGLRKAGPRRRQGDVNQTTKETA